MPQAAGILNISWRISARALGSSATTRGLAAETVAERAFHVLQADRANLALGLGDDMGGFKRREHVLKDTIDAFSFGQGLFHPGVDLARVARHIEAGGGANRQGQNIRQDSRIRATGRLEIRPSRSACTISVALAMRLTILMPSM